MIQMIKFSGEIIQVQEEFVQTGASTLISPICNTGSGFYYFVFVVYLFQTVVLFGNSASVQYNAENIIIGEENLFKMVETSRIVPVQREISEHDVSLINMIDLHETDCVDHLINQLVNENEIHAFIFVVRLGQLTDADKMGLEWLQRVFGDNVLQFVMFLFTYETEEKSDTIIDDLKKDPVLEQLLDRSGGRFHTCNKMMNNQSEMRDLMNKIEHLFTENKQQRYTGEMYNTVLKQREDLKKSKW
ncbi:uncharacterized protein LOC143711022 [Siphateles boraxobius]|uniref:uncharacterized protein LOC143711022 n=1 Tax=Siphateles boraxobius TaxID=180520 RepID=UPI0040646BBF